LTRSTPDAIRVLIVDDEPVLREALREFLEGAGMVVVGEAGDGLEALTSAAETDPDVVLMDVRMPRMDGLAATTELRARDPDLRIVLLSATDDEPSRAFAQRAGAADYLAKGIRPSELVAAITAAARRRPPHDPA
jgi:DNA-binding NarL/FixJ family response regulator